MRSTVAEEPPGNIKNSNRNVKHHCHLDLQGVVADFRIVCDRRYSTVKNLFDKKTFIHKAYFTLIFRYLMSMENSRDIEDYLQSMLDVSNPEHRRFVEGLLTRLGHAVVPVEKSTAVQKNNDIVFKGQPTKPQKDLPNNQQHSKKRVKQINLFSKEGQAKESITLPGQHR